jgi:hypothetical protein
MRAALTALLVFGCLCATAAAQTPSLSRPQRELLTAMVNAVDAASTAPESADASLRTHVLRASDGSHYVAFSLTPSSATSMPPGVKALYIRLATVPATIPAQRAERSVIRDWLAGMQNVLPPIIANRGIALGDMPIMGATGNIANPARAPMNAQTADLAAMDLERRRARERQEQREKQRRAELEGRAAMTSDTLPFEDFDLNAARSPVIQRALTAGPGDYFLYTAWADPSSPQPAVHVIKKRLVLPAATTTELTIGSPILADGIQIRTAPYKPAEQASHPYAIGLTEIVPAADALFTDTENMSVVFQVINARHADSGKPDVDVVFQVVRVVNSQEQAVAALTPQNYSERNLPAEFDLRAGHPLFATVSAPLSTLRRGSYRLKILVTDRIAGHTATADTDFSVAATALSLLREAPPLGLPFQREPILSADVLPNVLAALRPASPSPALRRAFDLAAAARFVDLMVEEPVPDAEEALRAALRGLAMFAVGDASAAVQFQRAQLLGAPPGITRFLSGAARAQQARDADAIAAWQEALKSGAPQSLVAPYLLDAYVRRNDIVRAAALLTEIKNAPATWSRSRAAILIATQKESEAIALLEARLAATPADLDAQWLLLQSLFARLARETNTPAAIRERFTTLARAYIDAKGINAALAQDWLTAIS